MINEIKNKVEKSRDEDLLRNLNTYEIRILTNNLNKEYLNFI